MNSVPERPLKICLISYRSNPHCGGQGVYIRNLSRALKDLGHDVDVIAGPPDPLLHDDISITKITTLDLYNPNDLFRTPSFEELKQPINFMEWLGISTMGYSEPFSFGLRAYVHLRDKFDKYDIVHDNQCLSYGIWAISRRIPTVATIHHPMTVDRKLAVQSVSSIWKKFKHIRWYSFIGMQKRVSRRLPKIITVSEFSRDDISRAYRIPKNKFDVVPNGINTELFYPLPHIPREPGRIIVTNSADTALKGLYYLLQAVEMVSKKRKVKLIVIGTPKKDGGIVKLIKTLKIAHLVRFTGRISNEEFVREYAKASMAVVPSLYEGFGLPVGEAMACAVPVITTTGGALPEVAGDAAEIVPPADPEAIADAIIRLMDDPKRAKALGEAGYRRVIENFTWKKAAENVVKTYREVMSDYGRV
ncbi:glycosyltransferase family 4 protein [Desulforegula conservatrix]|uniref:glycosyltransferase family 4 protein n=1 Tax=Desulforegula conservatrix TaxID=153026 RepID=UPI0003FEECB0|nr:glycosyltransferase family 4 protein [Desulforegula conservatrix]